MKDYYLILGVSPNTSSEEIKKRFHELAHKYHPDKPGGDAAKFKEVSEAYNALKDKKGGNKNKYTSSNSRSGYEDTQGFGFSAFWDAFKAKYRHLDHEFFDKYDIIFNK